MKKQFAVMPATRSGIIVFIQNAPNVDTAAAYPNTSIQVIALPPEASKPMLNSTPKATKQTTWLRMARDTF